MHSKLKAAKRKQATEGGPSGELHAFPHLKELIGPVLSARLSESPALRPVFFMDLPKESLGTIEVISNLNSKSQVLDIINAHSVFLMSPYRRAELMAMINSVSGVRMIAGAVDRESPLSLRAGISKSDGADIFFPVANGRQAYFPQLDGSWIGVKGCGQFLRADGDPYMFSENFIGDFKWYGFVTHYEVEALSAYKDFIQEGAALGYFPNVLGFRELKTIPNLDGVFISPDELRPDTLGRKSKPSLVFSQTLSPHRLSKIPQILDYDPGLVRSLQEIKTSLQKVGLLELNAKFEISDWLLFIAARVGVAERFKIENGFGKITMHLQDINLAGQEHDTEELRPYSETQGKRHGIKVKNGMLKDLHSFMLTRFGTADLPSWKSVEESFRDTIK